MNCSRCRAALPAGSLFCNACGSPVQPTGQTQAMPPQPPPQNRTQQFAGPPQTQQYQSPLHAQTQQFSAPPYPPQAAPGQPMAGDPYRTQQVPQQPYAAAGYPQAAYPPAEASPKRRPVLLLSALLVLLLAGLGGAGVLMLRRNQNPLVGAAPAPLPAGPGVTQTASADLPQGPGVTATQSAPLAPGAPVTGTVKKPDNEVPSIMMAPGSRVPQGGSVTTVQTPSIPTAPSVLQAPGQPARPTLPVTGVAPSAPSAPAAPAPRDNGDFDRYIQWLRFVEQERSALRAQGETESFRIIEQFYGVMLGFSDPAADDIALQRQFDQNLRNSLNRALTAVQVFRTNIMRTKPPVPSDCKSLDNYYMAAVDEESRQTAALMQSLAGRDMGAIRSISKVGVGRIDQNLGMANKQLAKAYEGRGLNQQFTIETGGNSSMLGGLIGLGGMR